jgi:hypothetical protein
MTVFALLSTAADGYWKKYLFVASKQGDQIGRILAPWVIVYFGQFFKIKEVAHILELHFIRLRFLH